MDSKTEYIAGDTFGYEIGTVTHEGREFACGGFAVNLESGRMVGYVRADPTGYVLTTWDGQTVVRLERTDNHPRMLEGYYGLVRRARGGPQGFGGVKLLAFRTAEPFLGFYWHGRGQGAEMILKLSRGRKG